MICMWFGLHLGQAIGSAGNAGDELLEMTAPVRALRQQARHHVHAAAIASLDVLQHLVDTGIEVLLPAGQ
jgi:hypothetical protein